jgi:hypothetical protein
VEGEEMKVIRFIGTGDPEVSTTDLHLEGPLGDYTLCGDTLDGDDQTSGDFEEIESPYVTCPRCIEIINICKGVKTKNLRRAK